MCTAPASRLAPNLEALVNNLVSNPRFSRRGRPGLRDPNAPQQHGE
jgi:hypothetical protein